MDLILKNIIINQKKDSILIDFDRLTKTSEACEDQTQDFDCLSVAQEIYKTCKSDIYSLGYVIKYILNENDPVNKNRIFDQCLNSDPNKRPSIGELFYEIIFQIIQCKEKKKIFSLLETIDFFNQSFPEAQFYLGTIYHEGEYVTFDIEKVIHYYLLAANQSLPDAQFNLGVIYHESEYITRDINKAIHYYSLAVNQNYPQAQFNLGAIFFDGKYVACDINKAIHYFTLAANLNFPQAQFYLGFIYHEGKYVTRDIDKAIHYYSLAANHSFPEAQFNRGFINYLCKNIHKNIKKGRYYIMLSSKNNNKQAYFAHGFLLHEGKNIERNIEEAIHYYKEASSFLESYTSTECFALSIYKKSMYNFLKEIIQFQIIEESKNTCPNNQPTKTKYDITHHFF